MPSIAKCALLHNFLNSPRSLKLVMHKIYIIYRVKTIDYDTLALTYFMPPISANTS